MRSVLTFTSRNHGTKGKGIVFRPLDRAYIDVINITPLQNPPLTPEPPAPVPGA